MIQIGFTLTDEDGKLVEEDAVWQFNLQFDVEKDESNQAAINMLTNSGIDFPRMAKDGITQEDFAEKFMASGIQASPYLSLALSDHN